MAAPYNAAQIMQAASQVIPGTVQSQNAYLVQYYRRYLLQLAMSVFKWRVPDTWSKDYFLYVLYQIGYVAILNTDRYGVIPQQCTLSGYNVFYQPSRALIANPRLKGIRDLQIDTQTTIIKLMPDYGGIMDIVSDYAERLALASETCSINLINSKLSYIFTAKSKTSAESFKKMYDQVSAGNPAVVIDKSLLTDSGELAWQPFFQNVSQNYIAGDLQDFMARTISEFCTKIGIPANPYGTKKERQIVDEVNSNNIETQSLVSLWYESLQDGIKKAKRMFPGLKLGVSWRFPQQPKREEVAAHESEHDGSL